MIGRVVERENGVKVYRATDEAEPKNNIYCERSYCSPDSRAFVYTRFLDTEDHNDIRSPREYVLCEFGSWASHVIGRGAPCRDITRDGRFYFADAEGALRRVDLATGDAETVPLPEACRPGGAFAVSRDGRYLATRGAASFDPQMFSLDLINLTVARRTQLFRHPHVCNPHIQFEPGKGRSVLVQLNRGCRFSPEGKLLDLLGEEGCTLLVFDVADGAPRPLQVGPPHTPSVTGHEQWIAETGEVLFSTDTTWEDALERGNLLRVAPGGPARPVCPGHAVMHVHASTCGRFFCADETLESDLVHGHVQPRRTPSTCRVLAGSLDTGRTVVVDEWEQDYLDLHARFGQSGHTHPYLSPDARWLVYNCCRTGRPEVYVAELPTGMLEGLAEPASLTRLGGRPSNGKAHPPFGMKREACGGDTVSGPAS